jgi:alkylation response protein AidB-like acyl-CoA dehydrogenase
VKTRTWFDDTDAALADAAARYLGERYRFDTRQRLDAAARRFSPACWRDLAEMGWFSVATPEAAGGLGLRLSSICLLAEAAGRSLLTEPFVSAGVVAPFIVAQHGSAAQRELLLPAIHAGDKRVVPVLGQGDATALREEGGTLHGCQSVAIDADIADLLLVRTGADPAQAAFWIVDPQAAGCRLARYPLLDGRGAARLELDGAAAVRLGAADASVDARAALRLGALATAADSLGAMSAAFELTLDYLKTRRQFGAPLGTYQALQHRAVDMYIALGESRALLDQAIASLQADAPQAARDVHAAKSVIGEAARRVTQEAIQLHGGIGVTEEYAASHCLRRARVNEQLYGSAEHHFQAFAALASHTAF